MGDFRIIIDAIGGHGQDRDKKDGQQVDFTGDNNWHSATTPEAIAQTFIAALRGAGVNVTDAKIVHWPADNYGGPEQNGRQAGKEVVDNLITGVRTNQF